MWGRKFIVASLVSFFAIISFIPVAFDTHGGMFYFELVMILLFLLAFLLAAFGVYQQQRWSWQLYMVLFAVFMLNIIVTYFFSRRIYLFAIGVLACVAGFLYSVFNLETDEEYEFEKYHEKVDKGVEDDEVIVEEITPLKGSAPNLETYEEEFIGSTKRHDFHSPDCPAAKKIAKGNKIVFTSRSDAESQGYSKHNCIK